MAARTATSLNASSISCSVTCGRLRGSGRSCSSALACQTSRSSRGIASISAAARLKRSYSCSRRTSSARGSSSPLSPCPGGRGNSMRDLISASVAAITRYSPASSSCRSCISSMYWVYWRVISAIGILRMSTFWRRIRYNSRSSGPSNASRNISSACGGMYRSRGSWVMRSPLTMANGISTCSGDRGTGAAAGGGLDTTIFRSGFTIVGAYKSLRPQMHRATHLIEGGACRGARLLPAFGQDGGDHVGIFLEFLRPLAHAGDLLDDAFDQRLLAIEAADAGGAAALIDPLPRGLVRIQLVQIPHRALLRVARIGTSHPRRIGLHGLELGGDRIRLLAQQDRVAIGLGHLAAVQARHLGAGRQQHLRLGQDAEVGTLQVAQQAIAIGHRDARIALHQC